MAYLTAERWQHILESRPELEPYLNHLLDTLRTGDRKQDPLMPNKYRYTKRCEVLLPENTHLVVVVIFQTRLDAQGQQIPNNFVVTGWAASICGREGEPMSTCNLSQSDITADDGIPVRLVYDHEADILEIFFGSNEPATGIELTEHIILRCNLQTRRAVSLLLLNFSFLTEQTEYGPRSYPLTTLSELPDDVRTVVLRMVTSMPVKQFLKVSHLQASPTERVPLTCVEAQPTGVVSG